MRSHNPTVLPWSIPTLPHFPPSGTWKKAIPPSCPGQFRHCHPSSRLILHHLGGLPPLPRSKGLHEPKSWPPAGLLSPVSVLSSVISALRRYLPRFWPKGPGMIFS